MINMQIRTVHPFPARMAPELALDSLRSLPKGSLVLDPMSGSGTVLRQAIELGHRAVGFDMDPLAVLMSRVWTSHVDPKIYERELSSVMKEAELIDLRRTHLYWHDQETKDFVNYWFDDNQRRALTRLAAVLLRRRESNLGPARCGAVDALQIAFSRIIITKEQCASLARDTSHSRPHRVTDYSDYDVTLGFIRSAQQVIKRIGEPVKRIAEVQLGDARCTPLRRGSVDVILTSPPYLNAIDYMRGHRMSLVWLGYSLAQLRQIRSTTIGAERAAKSGDPEIARDITASMCKIGSLENRQQNMVSRYALDLYSMMLEAARVLKKSGTATFVVGNSCLKSTFVHNANGVVRAASLAGLKLKTRQERELPAHSRYLPLTATGSLSKRMRTEAVLTFST